MLKFTMNVKELKTMIDKGMAAINKKASLPALTRLYFQVEADGTVKTLGTDFEHYAEIRSNNVWNTSPGVFAHVMGQDEWRKIYGRNHPERWENGNRVKRNRKIA